MSTALAGALLACASYFVAKALPEPYMDEIFHVPQTQQYCAGDFLTWDPKITTPPGLYYVGWVAGQLTRSCSIQVLRSVNVIGLVAGAAVCSGLLDRPDLFGVIVTFPLLAFYAPLYYTDIWASVLVLIGLSLTLRQRHVSSAAVFTLSLLFRQTNVVWAGYAGMLALCGTRLPLAANKVNILSQIKQCVVSLKSPGKVVPYGFVAAVFAGFVVWNGGITLGDKSNHAVSINLPQLLYFALFTALFSVSAMLQSGWPLVYLRRLCSVPHALKFVAEGLGIAYIVSNFTIVHPFILADNRHYTFYLWRRVLHPSPTRALAVVPVYEAAVSWLQQSFVLSVEHLAFWAAVAAVLVPSPLLEPRYYALPYLIWRIFLVPRVAGWLELAWYLVIDIATWAIFCLSANHFMW